MPLIVKASRRDATDDLQQVVGHGAEELGGRVVPLGERSAQSRSADLPDLGGDLALLADLAALTLRQCSPDTELLA